MALFGNIDIPTRSADDKTRACAIAWRDFVANAYRRSGDTPSYDTGSMLAGEPNCLSTHA